MEKTLYIVIGSDTDPDRPGFIPGYHAEEGKSWRGMLEGVPRAKEALSKLLDNSGHPPVFTWCLRADYQMRALNGSYSFIMETHRDFLSDLERTGDELAWHPHFWNLDTATGKWYQEILDIDWQVRMLKDAFAAYSSLFPGRPKSVRMGWDYHNNRTLATLAELGIAVDFSGIPGWKIDPPSGGKGGYNCYDWRITPNNPYYPSRNDYRRPPRAGEEHLSILEAPNFVSTSFFWGTFGGSVMSVKMKNAKPFLRSLSRPTYWIAATGKSFLFAPLLSKIERILARQNKVFFVTYFHPDEFLLPPGSLYSLSNMESNLSLLLSLAKKLQAQVRFVRARDIPALASDAK